MSQSFEVNLKIKANHVEKVTMLTRKPPSYFEYTLLVYKLSQIQSLLTVTKLKMKGTTECRLSKLELYSLHFQWRQDYISLSK